MYDKVLITNIYMNKLSKIFLIFIMSICCLAANSQQLVTNPNIYQSSSYYQIPDGWAGETSCWRWTVDEYRDTYMECWNSSASDVSFNMYQTIKDIPNGMYEVRADMFNSTNGEVITFVGGECGLYAQSGDDFKFVGVTHNSDSFMKYSLVIYVKNNELTIGVKNIKTPTARWFGADNFDVVSLANEVHGTHYNVANNNFKYRSYAIVNIYDGAIPLDVLSAYELGVFNQKGECVGVKSNLSSTGCVVNVHSDNALGDILDFKLYNKYSGKEISLSSDKGKIVFDSNEEFFVGSFDVPYTLYVPQTETGIDISDKIVNHVFSDFQGKGWQYPNNLTSIHGGFEEFPCAEAYEMPFEIHQDIDGLENGLYKVTVNSFYRPGFNGTYNGTEAVPVHLMLDDFYTPVQHILSDPLPTYSAIDQYNCYLSAYTDNMNNVFTHNSGSDLLDYKTTSGYVPNGMTGASVAFLAGRYKQTVYGLVEDGNLRLGLTSMGKKAHWCLWSNFRLYYMEKDSTALDAVIRSYIDRAELMKDTINCENNNFVIRSLNTGISRATNSLGKDGDTMYDALLYLNGCIKNYIENLEEFVYRMNELQTLYASAYDLYTKEKYSGHAEFLKLLQEVKQYADDDYVSLDSNYSDMEYINLMINKLSTGVDTYNKSMNIPFPQELELLTSVVPSVKGYKVTKSHISSVDISNCGLESLPEELVALPDLTTINASYNHISDIANLDGYKTLLSGKSVNLQYQDIDETIDLDYEKILNNESLISQVPSLPYYDSSLNSYMKDGFAIGLSTQRPGNTNSSNWAINIDCNTDTPAVVMSSNGDNAYYGNSGDLLYVTYPLASNVVYGSYYRSHFYFDQGDANFVNGVDATDLQATILYAFGEYRKSPFNFTAADTYKDGNINVQDVICTVNLLLGTDNEQSAKTRSKLQDRTNINKDLKTDYDAQLFMNEGKIYLHSRVPVASLSIKTSGDIKWNLESVGLLQSVSNGNVVGYSLTGNTLPINEDVLLGEYNDATIHSMSLSDAEAQPISVFVNGNVTSVGNALEFNTSKMDVYDISGKKQNSIKEGINIIRSNGLTKKIYK